MKILPSKQNQISLKIKKNLNYILVENYVRILLRLILFVINAVLSLFDHKFSI